MLTYMHLFLFHAVLCKLGTLVVITTSKTCHFSMFCQLLPSYGGVVYKLKADTKISAGSVGNPTTMITCEIPVLVLTTAVLVRVLWQDTSLSWFIFTQLWLMMIIN